MKEKEVELGGFYIPSTKDLTVVLDYTSYTNNSGHELINFTRLTRRVDVPNHGEIVVSAPINIALMAKSANSRDNDILGKELETTAKQLEVKAIKALRNCT